MPISIWREQGSFYRVRSDETVYSGGAESTGAAALHPAGADLARAMRRGTDDRRDAIRVLIVDDHRMFADALELLLAAEEGLEAVGTASTGLDAVELCRRECPTVVLMDVDLPKMDGIETTREIRSICPDTQVVVIAALQTPDLLARAVEAGACGFVPKSSAADQLVSVIHRAAAGEMVLPEKDTQAVLALLARAREQHRAGAEPDAGPLSEREVEILRGLAEGKNTKELAEGLYISPYTVQSHVRNILMKLGVRSKLEAVLFALRAGIIELSDQPNTNS